jgi:hypothetical protein
MISWHTETVTFKKDLNTSKGICKLHTEIVLQVLAGQGDIRA